MRAETWADISAFHEQLLAVRGAHWLYRGQRDSGWTVRPKLERVLEDRFRESLAIAPKIQRRLIREFKRHLHRYTADLPADADELRWLALMQHHGAPTSLVDFTYSFFVALFFAVEHAVPPTVCSVWAIDHNWLWRVAKARLQDPVLQQLETDEYQGKSPAAVTAILETNSPIVVPLNPFSLDERLTAQQGLFLTSPDLTRRLHDTLNQLDTPEALAQHVQKLEISCTQDMLCELLSRLQRMNITRVSLFPGIDGLAQSLENLPAMPYRFLGDDTWSGPG